ncbi:sialate O-acetylesterase [Synoicihabitans lomoniglobus]|uniref:Sialate O-acetylesterase n=1 Tax=Synoicihabitans lomoniglobus TaxID=2909285 RepID=A0AAE9ZTZ6_9BACT|nr:sialate O-acetylesterase [Opitutaceae bacterium LMO-M01]WED64062.1 sialate O-acetylesterase [Opitutaceae bacterium LMO-M01]
MTARHFLLCLACLCGVQLCLADTLLPAVFSDHMVLQRNQPCRVWGWDDAGQPVTVSFAGQTHRTVSGDDGRWQVNLEPTAASSAPRVLRISGTTEVKINDVLVGEVWLCAGQSNMALALHKTWSGDLSALAAGNAQLRLLRVPHVGSPELKRDFEGQWEHALPATAANFSAVGYHFGEHLQRILGVPVGLIDNSWGGSAIETWISRAAAEAHPPFADRVDELVKLETYHQSAAAWEDYENQKCQWPAERERAIAEGRYPPPAPQTPDQWLTGNKRLGNGFGGSVHPLLGYGIRGVIWYQGESNAGRAADYYDQFPFLIEQWRSEWGQGNFPFYWVQLPGFIGFTPDTSAPGDAAWAELREAQTRAQTLPHTGQAVTIDLGEGNDIHPRLKLPVAQRLLRLALHHDYGFKDLSYRSPEYRDHAINGDRVTISFDCFGSSLRTINTADVQGFAICGEDQIWHWAEAEIVGDSQVKVWAPGVDGPVAVRYAWSNNPPANLITTDGLPATPFRTDDFPLSTRSVSKN